MGFAIALPARYWQPAVIVMAALAMPLALAQDTPQASAAPVRISAAGDASPASAQAAPATRRRSSIAAILSIILDGDSSSTPPVMQDIPRQVDTVSVAISPAINLANYVTATNGDAVTGYAIASGSLPPGLSLDTTTGVISGTPTTVGTYSFAVTASDKDGVSAAKTVQYSILAPGPSSYALIDAAQAAGTLTQEQALLYKLYVDFDYPLLPAQYKGNDSQHAVPESEAQVLAYIDQAGISNISPATLEAFWPFFVPAYFEGSWWHQRRDLLAAQAQAARGGSVVQAATIYCKPWENSLCGVLGDWKTVSGSKMAIWYLAANETADRPKALALLAAFEGTGGIWDKLTGLMQPPMADTGLVGLKAKTNGLRDVFLIDMEPKVEGNTKPSTFACKATPAYIHLSRTLPMDGLLSQAVHEFMHTIQYSYNSQSCMDNYYTIKEATAVWATHYMYPSGIGGKRWEVESGYAKRYLDNIEQPYDAKLSDDLYRYGAYLFPLFLEQQFDPQIIKEIWQQTLTYSRDLDAIDYALRARGKSFEQIWPKFAAANFSKNDPNNYFYKWVMQSRQTGDLTPIKHGENNGDSVVTGGSGYLPWVVNVPHAAASYHRIVFNRTDTRNLLITNGISFKAQAVSYPGVTGQVMEEAHLTADERHGASMQLLFKVNGAWLSDTVNITNRQGAPMIICRDEPTTRVDEIVVIFSNGEIDSAKPNYGSLVPRGEAPGIQISNIGCRTWTGSINLTGHTGTGSVTESLTGNFTMGRVDVWKPIVADSDPGPYDPNIPAVTMGGGSPLYHTSGTFHWNRSGSYTSGSKTCTQSGSADFNLANWDPVGGVGDRVLPGSGASERAASVIAFPNICQSFLGCWGLTYTDSCSTGGSSKSSGIEISTDLQPTYGPVVYVSSDGLSVSGTGAQAEQYFGPGKVTGTWSFTAQAR